MHTRKAIAIDDPILAHTEIVNSTAELRSGDLAVALDRTQTYPPGFLLPIYEMTASGLINRETKAAAESGWADGLTIYRVKA
jgi:hypothetical protein